jgi:hypothetical protein
LNSLERSLLEKLGYDNGWEVVSDHPSGPLVLASARHNASVSITPEPSGQGYQLGFPNWISESELTRSCGCSAQQGIILVKDREALASVLGRAAELATSLPTSPVVTYENTVAEILDEDPSQRGTEREAIVRQRVGQDVYRQALLDYWQGRCAVTGIAVSEVLRASHAKPWAECRYDHERLNVYNGFLLSANLDALFDKGLITFEDSGHLCPSPHLAVDDQESLGIDGSPSLRWIAPEHLPFLRWHREYVYRVGRSGNTGTQQDGFQIF